MADDKKPRRGKGEGSLGIRRDGLHYSVLTLPDGRRRWFYGKSRAEVVRKRNEAIKLQARGKLPSADRTTLADWLPKWLENKRAEGVAPATYIKYRGHIRRHILPALGHVRLSALTPQHLRDFYAAKGAAGLSPQTVTGIHAVLHGALRQAMVDEVLTRNVAGLVRSPRGTPAEVVAYTAEQARTFLRAIRGDRLEAMYLAMILTGLRLGELLGLRWRDIDAADAVLHVRQAQRRALQGWEMAAPKTDAGARDFPLSPGTWRVFERHKGRQDMERLWAGAAWRDNDLVFPQPDGRPIHPTNWRRDQYYPLLERAGLPRLKPHGLRHTFASLLLSRGVPLSFVSELMGHTGIDITKDVYGHIDLTAKREAITALDNLLTDPE